MKITWTNGLNIERPAWCRLHLCHAPTILCLLLLNGCMTNSNKSSWFVGSDSIAEIPFYLESGVIIIEAKINGKSGRFLFDNGFSQSALDAQFAQAAGVEFKNESFLTDFNKTKKSTPLTTVDTAQIDHFYFLHTPFYQVDTDLIFPCDTIHGIIGGSIINEVNWQIDFDKNTIRISKKPFINQGIPLEIEFRNNNETFTQLSLGENTSVNCKIDFGSNGALKLRYEDVIDHLKGIEVEKRKGVRAISIHGPGPVETYYYTRNPVKIHQDTNAFLPASTVIIHDLKYNGYLGTEYFRQYLVSINSSNKEYLLLPRDSNRINQDHKLTYGLSLYPIDNQWVVIHKNETDESLSDVSVFDDILEIDNQPIAHFQDICMFRQYMENKKKDKEELVLRISGQDTAIVVPYAPPAISLLD